AGRPDAMPATTPPVAALSDHGPRPRASGPGSTAPSAPAHRASAAAATTAGVPAAHGATVAVPGAPVRPDGTAAVLPQRAGSPAPSVGTAAAHSGTSDAT